MDAWHIWGGDLQWGPTGDLRAVSGSEAGRQRVLRRLLTPRAGYVWNPAYGAGLPEIVGEPGGALLAEARAREQILLERAVAADPAPTIAARGDARGVVSVSIAYQDADTAEPVAIGFTIRD